MRFAADKVVEAGNRNVMLTERGTTFGYQDLVIAYRSIPEMQTFGFPVILDVTPSLQQPNQTSGVTGGMPQLIETVAKAGVDVYKRQILHIENTYFKAADVKLTKYITIPAPFIEEQYLRFNRYPIRRRFDAMADYMLDIDVYKRQSLFHSLNIWLIGDIKKWLKKTRID